MSIFLGNTDSVSNSVGSSYLLVVLPYICYTGMYRSIGSLFLSSNFSSWRIQLVLGRSWVQIQSGDFFSYLLTFLNPASTGICECSLYVCAVLEKICHDFDKIYSHVDINLTLYFILTKAISYISNFYVHFSSQRQNELESQVRTLQSCLRSVAAGRPISEVQPGQSQNLKDREILEFLGERDNLSSEP